jgi:steroid delta-isomerase
MQRIAHRGLWCLRLVSAFLCFASIAPVAAMADDAGDVRARLEQWVLDFNAGRARQACDLFSRELVSDVRGQGEADYARRCALITEAIGDGQRRFRYDLQIKEILAGRELVVVRLRWTLHVLPQNVRSVETGIDVFKKEADGAWRIVRYMAYEE